VNRIGRGEIASKLMENILIYKVLVNNLKNLLYQSAIRKINKIKEVKIVQIRKIVFNLTKVIIINNKTYSKN